MIQEPVLFKKTFLGFMSFFPSSFPAGISVFYNSVFTVRLVFIVISYVAVALELTKEACVMVIVFDYSVF